MNKDSILRVIRRDLEERRHKDVWWQNSLDLDQSIIIEESYEDLVMELFDELELAKGHRKLNQWKLNLKILLGNLLHQKRKPIAIHFTEDYYYKQPHNYLNINYSIVEITNRMEAKNYIEQKAGYKTEKGSRLTRIRATNKLLERCPKYNRMVVYKPNQLVILTDANKKLKAYRDTPQTMRVREILRECNEVNNRSHIICQGHQLKAYIRAIYKEKFSWYGRLHTKGYRHWQGYPESIRKDITIDGQPVIELDYCGLAPNMLYAAEGIQYEKDPYSVVDPRPNRRPFLKKILLMMINSDSYNQAQNRANSWLTNNSKKRKDKPRKLYYSLKKTNEAKARIFMDKFLKEHQPISKYFFKGKSTLMELFNKDSKMALFIIQHFSKKGVPIFPIHDSFIVQEKYRDELKMVMQKAYAKYNNGFKIDIK
jgi:hypothetical protein